MTERKAEYKAAYKASDTEMQDYAPRIRAVLASHNGRNRAINADHIAAQVGITGKNANRRVRMIVARMIDDGALIGSSPHEPRGYWLIQDRDEVRDVLANWRNRSIAIMRRYKILSDRAFQEFGIPVEQIKMEL